MAINTISYDTKSDIETSSVPNNNKVSANDLNEIKQVVNQIANLVGDGDNLIGASNIIDYLMNRTYGKIIWTNPDPSINFSAQTITLDESLDNYDEYEILVLQSTQNSRLMSTGRIPVGHGTIISYNTSSYLYRPTGSSVSGNTIYFEDAKGVAGTTVTVQNDAVIPMYVIGYKTGIFE